ncbi:ribosomal protein S10 domain-containing protein [Suillus clintonianus]|uniref:ribosomal protein S10 domain-containing protein n=1 Tax=Suillus clintonianus TaxID=1904413 RepID=UPI001B885AA0|nr:ribosomal protein S10 domain-containing protein [Suillus clintonianus]KAG2149198.1 ribosomal protein S10 domain-containing protein [Suillus clintonianus]
MFPRQSRLALPTIARLVRFNGSSHVTATPLPTRQPEPEVPVPLTEEEFSSAVIHGRSLYPPLYHPRTHSVPVAQLQFRAYHPQFLELYMHLVGHAAAALGIPISRPVYLPTQRSLWTVPRGPFVHKKSQENFERKIHKRAIKAWDADPEVVDRWVRYITRHAMPGVGLRVTQWKRAPPGIGQQMVDAAVGQTRLGSGADNVKELAKKIVQQEL